MCVCYGHIRLEIATFDSAMLLFIWASTVWTKVQFPLQTCMTITCVRIYFPICTLFQTHVWFVLGTDDSKPTFLQYLGSNTDAAKEVGLHACFARKDKFKSLKFLIPNPPCEIGKQFDPMKSYADAFLEYHVPRKKIYISSPFGLKCSLAL